MGSLRRRRRRARLADLALRQRLGLTAAGHGAFVSQRLHRPHQWPAPRTTSDRLAIGESPEGSFARLRQHLAPPAFLLKTAGSPQVEPLLLLQFGLAPMLRAATA
jgi:hypothetical protein